MAKKQTTDASASHPHNIREALLPFYYEGKIEAGCDEAGRGCLAGPVFAGAVILPPDVCERFPELADGLNDSKQLTEKKRYALRELIERDATAWAVGIVSNEEIDKINILRASILAMHRALDQLKVCPEAVIVDGNRFKEWTPQTQVQTPHPPKGGDTLQGGEQDTAAMRDCSTVNTAAMRDCSTIMTPPLGGWGVRSGGTTIPYTTIVKGDGKYLSIAAASILAKTYRDDFMKQIHLEYPDYQWNKNKGYPAKVHREAIRQHGTTPYHRLSFNLLGESAQLEFDFGS